MKKYLVLQLLFFCDDADCEQITKQVEKLIDVIRVVELSRERGVFRELALIKVSCLGEMRSEIISIADIFRANIIDVSSESVTIELTGEKSKIEAFQELMKPYGIREVVRTGLTGLCRGGRPIKKVKAED